LKIETERHRVLISRQLTPIAAPGMRQVEIAGRKGRVRLSGVE
jgi:hypothetical protein